MTWWRLFTVFRSKEAD